MTKLTITRGDGAGGAIGPSRWGDWRPYPPDTLRFTYAGTAPLRFEALVFNGMGHVYSNGTNHPVDIASLAWAFFAAP